MTAIQKTSPRIAASSPAIIFIVVIARAGSTFVSASSNVRRAVSGSPRTRRTNDVLACVDAEEERIEEREGDGDDAKAEHDRRDDRQRHERRPAERAQREADVARERPEDGDPALVAALVRGERHGAEACVCAPARLRGTETVGHEFSRFTLDVEAELVAELPLDLAGREEGA
jgi:hypothetical protein